MYSQLLENKILKEYSISNPNGLEKNFCPKVEPEL